MDVSRAALPLAWLTKHECKFSGSLVLHQTHPLAFYQSSYEGVKGCTVFNMAHKALHHRHKLMDI